MKVVVPYGRLCKPNYFQRSFIENRGLYPSFENILKETNMKNPIVLPIFILSLCFSTIATAQKFSGLDKSPLDIAYYPSGHMDAEKSVRVLYSRPQLKGRNLADLIPAGEVWRTGANEATEITFYKDAVVGGQTIAAGTYSLFTIPGEDHWTVILNSNLHQWGAYSYGIGADVARIPAKVSTAEEELEAFSVAFSDQGDLVMGWGTTRVTLPIGS